MSYLAIVVLAQALATGGGHTGRGEHATRAEHAAPAASVGRVTRVTRVTHVTRVTPVLAFPEPGLDDSAAYQGYQTRFFRDSRGNTVQVYLEPRGGRVVLVWADALNESVAFTVRDVAERPARLVWGSEGAVVSDSGRVRTIAYRLTVPASRLEIGWFLLGSMRLERDFQYARRHLAPFGAPPFRVPELEGLLAGLEHLPAAVQRRHLALLGAGSVRELRARLDGRVEVKGTRSSGMRIVQPSLDGRNHLALELDVDPRQAAMAVVGRVVSVRALRPGPITLAVRASTDGEPLTPLTREEIFNRDFLQFLGRVRSASDSGLHSASDSGLHSASDSGLRAAGGRGGNTDQAVLRYRWLERQVRGLELLSSREKLMAGLPNYGTYFGRDMMMSALMMRPIWTEAMSEHVIASVLRKLSPTSWEVSHEEALGGQAIRENAGEYAELVGEAERQARRGNRRQADSVLARARDLLGDLQRVRENYHMRDDEFQLPVLEARYLGDPRVGRDRKRAFLLEREASGRGTDIPRLVRVVRELEVVASLTAPYAREPVAVNLVGFPKRDSTHWQSGSWRDSGAGYANGRFAMDINAIWVPQALASVAEILTALHSIGFTDDTLRALVPGLEGTPLWDYVRHPESLQAAIATWNGAERHFVVTLTPQEVATRVQAKLAWLPEKERRYWQAVVGRARPDSLTFLALSLDSAGRPIPVVNTDPATGLFLGDAPYVAAGQDDTVRRARVLLDLRAIMEAYPIGLFIEGLGPVVANDAYASPEVWEAFRADQYHSPRVVWGREVNLLILGLAHRLGEVADSAGHPLDAALEPYAQVLERALRRTVTAVEASGLKHNELWSYRIEGDRLFPIRYGTSTDVQLWNLTNLVVQYELSARQH